MQYDYEVSRLAYQQEVEQLQMRIDQSPINRKTKDQVEQMKADYEGLELNDNDMTGVSWSFTPEEFALHYNRGNGYSLKHDPSHYKTVVYKKEELDKTKDYQARMRLKVWRDVMMNDDITTYPKYEENILDDILGGDDNVL